MKETTSGQLKQNREIIGLSGITALTGDGRPRVGKYEGPGEGQGLGCHSHSTDGGSGMSGPHTTATVKDRLQPSSGTSVKTKVPGESIHFTKPVPSAPGHELPPRRHDGHFSKC